MWLLSNISISTSESILMSLPMKLIILFTMNSYCSLKASWYSTSLLLIRGELMYLPKRIGIYPGSQTLPKVSGSMLKREYNLTIYRTQGEIKIK